MASLRIFGRYVLGHRTVIDSLERYFKTRSEFDPVVVHRCTRSIPERLSEWSLRPFLHALARSSPYDQIRWMLSSITKGQADIDFFHTQHSAAGALVSRAKRVVSIDTTGRLTDAMLGGNYYEKSFFLEKRILQRANLVVCMSDWVADSARMDYGVPAQNIVIVRNGMFSSDARPHIGGEGWLFVGNDFRRKGGDLVLRVHQRVLHAEPRLTIVTSPRLAPYIRGKNVRVLHSVPHDRLIRELFPRSDLFVFPARVDYSPWVVLEALWAGVPVITTRVGSISEMVRDGLNGFLLAEPSEGALVAALEKVSDASLLTRMSLAARQEAERRYDLEKNYALLCDRMLQLL